jgi:tetratricopeptide (TPR) repeat protein
MPAARRVAPWVGAGIVAAAAVAAALWLRTCDRPDAPVSSGPSATPPAVERPRAPAAAAPSSAPELVDAGRAEAAGGRYVQALALYQRAHDIDPRPATLLEIARMLHLSGRCRDARRTTQRVLASSPDSAVADDATQLLERIGRCD